MYGWNIFGLSENSLRQTDGRTDRQTERERECVWKLCVKVSRPDGRTPVSAFEDHTNWAAVDEHLLYPEHIFAQHVRRPIRLAATMNEDGNQSSQRAFKELVDDPVSSR